MNKINIVSGLAIVLLMLSSCADDSLSPIITFDKAIKGAYVRLLVETPRELDLANLAAASYTYTVEFVDEQQGALVDEYEVSATYIDNNPVNGDGSAGPVVIKTFTSADFTDSERGCKDLKDIVLTMNELATGLGVNTADILANDQFRIDGRIITSDGKEFTFENSSAAINGSAFQGHFRFTLKATCPLPPDIFVGNYELTYDEVGGGWDESLVEGTVTLKTVSGSSTKRAFDAVFLDIFGGFNVTVELDFVCDQVVMVDLDSGVGCGNNITLLGAGLGQPVDIADPNAVLIIWYVEDTGDCGAGTPTREMRLTPG